MYNCHIHTFKECDIPRGFLPLGLVSVLSTKVGYFMFSRILKNLNPFSNKDQFDRYITFVKIGKKGSQSEILDMCAENYPKDTKFIVLPMDMEFMGAGRVPRKYEEQLAELVDLKNTNHNVIAFIHVDVRRNNYLELFHAAMKDNFQGVKLYPPLGMFPFDSRMNEVYKYCEENKMPVLAHCTSGNPVHFKGNKKQTLELLKDSKLPVDESKSVKELCSLFTHPYNYSFVFEKFPKLKICLAHFGRENEWDKIIRNMMQIYMSLYVDISYSLYDEEHWAYLKVLLSTDENFRNKCLFGSDWYMNALEGKEQQFSIKLRGYLGEELWQQITVINPKKFLYA